MRCVVVVVLVAMGHIALFKPINQTIQELPEDIKEQNEIEEKYKKKSKKGKKISKIKDKDEEDQPPTMTEYAMECRENVQMHAIETFPELILPLWKVMRNVVRILEVPVRKKPKKIFYEDNFANLHGGAKIIMKSSPKIKYVNSILEDTIDKYMYTNEQLPIKIIIGLNEQIAIQSIIIKSFQMYSSITEDFQVQGSFSLKNPKWVHLGSFKAANNFNDQEFFTERKIVRYIKIKFLSAYGKWSYFTLTQIKIRGTGLFADALTELTQKKLNQEQLQRTQALLHEEDKQKDNQCPNEFKPQSKLPHQANFLSSLINKIDNLQVKNQLQLKEIKQLEEKLHDVTSSFVEAATIIEQMKLKQPKSNVNSLVMMFSLGVSVITLLSLCCLCCMRRKQLSSMRTSAIRVKKTNSNL